MNLLHLVQCYYPALGGSEGLMRNLSEQLVRDYGDQVTVFTSANINAESFWRGKWPVLPTGTETLNGVTVRRFRVYAGLQRVRGLLARGSRRLHLPGNDWLRTLETGPIIREYPAAIAAHAAHQADVVFATSFPFLHMYYAVAGARQAYRPVVLLGAIHTADHWGYDRANMLAAIRRADAYIAHTTHERDYLTARGIDPCKVRIIGGGVHAAAFAQAVAHGEGEALRRERGWGDDPLIVSVARHSSLKRLDVAIQAMPLVWGVYPRARLVLAGAATSYTPALERLVQELPMERREQVVLIRNFAEAEKPRLLAAADLVVHTSINESFAIALVEAWAGGKAVIGGDMGAIPSVIEPGRDGLLYHYPDPASLAQAIVVLLSNPAARRRMGEAGRAKVQANYTWSRVAAQVRTVYADVIAAHPKQRSRSA
jgi:glycosyltransferase involved in cell wall biosynthesis